MAVPIPQTRIVKIPTGDAGTVATVRYMGRMIRKGSASAPIRSLAVSVAMQKKTDIDKIRAIFDFVKSRMNYVRDNAYMETVAEPAFHLKQFVRAGYAAGDCDDHVVFLGSLLGSVGYPVRIVTVRVRPGMGSYDHVYLEVLARGTWIPLDATNKRMPMGWAVPRPTRIRKFNI